MADMPDRTWTRGPHYDYHFREPVPNSEEFVRVAWLREQIEGMLCGVCAACPTNMALRPVLSLLDSPTPEKEEG